MPVYGFEVRFSFTVLKCLVCSNYHPITLVTINLWEAHPIVRRVLERCTGAPVPLASAAVACLVEAGDGGAALDVPVGRTAALDPSGAVRALGVAPGAGRAFTSGSPFDRAAVELAAAQPLVHAELGAAGSLANLAVALADGVGAARVVDVDPHGAAWAVGVLRAPHGLDSGAAQ